jgi:hypothetical protein
MDAPCCDVFRLVNGKIQSFDCYPSGTVIIAQLGVLSNIEAAIVGARRANGGRASDEYSSLRAQLLDHPFRFGIDVGGEWDSRFLYCTLRVAEKHAGCR